MNETLQTIHALRTIHGDFSDKQVSDEDLATIVEASVRAANASARQSYSIVIVDDPETMDELCGYRASRLLLYCVDYNRICDLAEHLGYTFHAGEPISFVTGRSTRYSRLRPRRSRPSRSASRASSPTASTAATCAASTRSSTCPSGAASR